MGVLRNFARSTVDQEYNAVAHEGPIFPRIRKPVWVERAHPEARAECSVDGRS